MLVGGLTVACDVPKNWLPMSFAGRLKFGWLNKLKNCKPIAKFALSHFGILVFFVKLKSVSKYEGPRNLLRRSPKSVSAADAYPSAYGHGLLNPCWPKWLSLLQFKLVMGSSGVGKKLLL